VIDVRHSNPPRWTFKFDDATPVSAAQLEGQVRSFTVKRRVGDELILSPILPKRRNDRSTKPTVTVDDLVERGDLTKAFDRIEYLAQRKDDHPAWRELMRAYRHEALRHPLHEAYRRVGFERIAWMLEKHPDDSWDAAMVAFVLAEATKPKGPGPINRRALPHEGTGFERPAWADD
jgi:hypothetical protein